MEENQEPVDEEVVDQPEKKEPQDNSYDKTEDQPSQGKSEKAEVSSPVTQSKPVSPVKPKSSFFQKISDGIKGLAGVTGNQNVRDGYRFLKQQQYQQAILSFQTAIKENDTNPDGYIGIAKTLSQKGGINNAKNAVTYLQKGIHKDPFSFELYEETIRILEKLGKGKEAATERKRLHTVKSLKNDPTNPTANNNMGIISLQLKQFEQAIDYFTKATKYKSDYRVAHINLAKAWFQQANKTKETEAIEACKKALEKAVKLEKTADLILLYARLLILEKQYEEALKQCDVAYELDGSNKDVFGVKKLCNEKMANLAEANMDYETYKSLEKAEKEIS